MVSEIEIAAITHPMRVAPKKGDSLASEPSNDANLRKAARALEAGFIAEMLKSAGVGKTPDSFGGGAGEDGFASFLVSAQAEKIVEAGGFGLAEQIFNSLVKDRSNDA